MGDLLISKCRISCIIQEPEFRASFLGEKIRGVFGKSLLHLIELGTLGTHCPHAKKGIHHVNKPDVREDSRETFCQSCDRRTLCVYARIFKPNIVNNSNEPPPFVLSVSNTAAIEDVHFYAAGEPFVITLTLLGREALASQQILILAMALGIKTNLPFLRLDTITDFFSNDDKNDPDKGQSFIKGTKKLSTFKWSQKTEDSLRAQIAFSSPLIYTTRARLGRYEQYRVISNPPFGFTEIFERVLIRLEAVKGMLFDTAPVFSETLIPRAKHIQCTSSLMKVSQVQNTKIRSYRFMGTMDLKGDLNEYIPLLQLASLVHIGGSPSMGYGDFSLTYDS